VPDRLHALLEAARLIGAQGHDLDAVLDALAEQARLLLRADAVGVNLTGPDGTLVIRRPNPLATPGSHLATAGAVTPLGTRGRQAMETRHPVVTLDVRADTLAAPMVRNQLAEVGSSVAVPLYAADAFQGLLYLDWRAPGAAGAADLQLVEALAAHAAVAIRTARLAAEAAESRLAAEAALTRERALARAVETISRDGADLDAILDALSEEARRLFDADDVVIQLRDLTTGVLIRRRTRSLAEPGTALAARRSHEPDAFMREVYATGRAMIATDFALDERIDPEVRAAQTRAVSTMAVPLQAGGETLGSLVAVWARRQEQDPELIEVAGALGRHAAIAIRTARLVEQSEQRRAFLDAVLDQMPDGVVVLDAPTGRLVLANALGREIMRGAPRDVPLNERLRAYAVRDAATGRLLEPEETAFGRALRGEAVESDEYLFRPPNAAVDRVVRVAARPLRDEAGALTHVVGVFADVTDARERARLEGAVFTARATAHEMNNQIQIVASYAGLLAARLTGDDGALAVEVEAAALAVGQTVARLQRIVRFEASATPVGLALDVDASTH
jgi:GAF domain-containing protein